MNNVFGRIFVENKPDLCTKCPFCAKGCCNATMSKRMLPNVAIESSYVKYGDIPPKWCPLRRDDDIKTKALPEEMYDELCALLTNYENSNEYIMGTVDSVEWLDAFYDTCVRLQNSVIQ